MSLTIAIDPGVKNLGWSLFLDRELIRCGVTRTKKSDAAQAAQDHLLKLWAFATCDFAYSKVVVECPRIYPVQQQKGDQNDLIRIAAVGSYVMGALALSHARPVFVFPHEWKGQMPKDVSHRRIEAKLTKQEKRVLGMLPSAKTVRHNGLDAVGIGLWAEGRKP